MIAIEVQDLRKTYKDAVEAVRGISFQVNAGEVFGLLGPNGAGKTSTVRILTTMSPASGGTVRIMGHDVAESPQEVRRTIGYVAQGSGVDQLATARENLQLQGRLFHLPKAEIMKRSQQLLELFGLEEVADRAAKTYSGGMKRRLDVALGLVHSPKILFLDEPTTGLDPASRITLWREMKRLVKEEGLTLLMTTHYLEEADQMADRLAIIDRGEIVGYGTPDELKSKVQGGVISVQLTGANSALDRAQELLSGLEGISHPIVEGNMIHVQNARGASAVPTIVSALEAEGLGLQQVALNRPSLDEVYLSLTGRSFGQADTTATTSSAEDAE